MERAFDCKVVSLERCEDAILWNNSLVRGLRKIIVGLDDLPICMFEAALKEGQREYLMQLGGRN